MKYGKLKDLGPIQEFTLVDPKEFIKAAKNIKPIPGAVFHSTPVQKNKFFEMFAKNTIIMPDGTVSPKAGHNQCTGRWDFDGQIYWHECNGSKNV